LPFSRLRRPNRLPWESLDRRLLMSAVNGVVFNDLNGNGLREGLEPGLSGWSIHADANNNGVVDANQGSATVNATDIPKPINDNATATSNLSVTGTSLAIADVNVRVTLTHSYLQDLNIRLRSPAGTIVTLWANQGGGSDNLTNTLFDDQATTSIGSGTAPYTGSFVPSTPLAGFNGQLANGSWQLQVQDNANSDTGSLVSWSIFFTFGEPVVSTNASGAYALSSLPAGTYPLRLTQRPDYTPTTPLSQSITVVAGNTLSNINFGQRQPPGSITGTVYNDANNNGSRDTLETGLANWTVFLDTNANNALDSGEVTTVTNPAGQYTFSNLSPGSYRIAQVVQAGWAQSDPGGVAPAGALLAVAQVGSSAAVDSKQGVRNTLSRLADLKSYSAQQISSATKWLVGDVSAAALNRAAKPLGLTRLQPAAGIDGAFVIDFAKSSSQILTTLRSLGATYVLPIVQQARFTRNIPNDPRFNDQWHLRNVGQAMSYTTTRPVSGFDANVVPAWANGDRGAGVVIGVVDDGVQTAHPDLAANIAPGLSFDFVNNDPDPTPADSNDDHGTSVAGVAAGRGNNGVGVSGAAPDAQIAGLQLLQNLNDAAEAASHAHFRNDIDIYSNSWGPSDTGSVVEAPGPLMAASLRDAALLGRNGLGNIITWAGGNGGNADESNYDGYANSRYVIAVGAVNSNGVRSSYSERGSNLLVSAYSNGGLGITTTTTLGGYTNNFGGTSSATPLVSGVIALMLGANPSLTWRDVQHILVRTSRDLDLTNGQWTINAAGFRFSPLYGHGTVDAAAAVTLSKTWNNVSSEISLSSGPVAAGAAIPDNNTTGVSRTTTLVGNLQIETVEVTVNVAHTNRGQLRYILRSPAGTETILAQNRTNDTGSGLNNWTFTSKAFWGEAAAGTWTLRVVDTATGVTGTLTNFTVSAYGTSPTNRGRFAGVASGYQSNAGAFGNVDVAAPMMLSSNFEFQTRQAFNLVFSEDVAASLSASDFVIAPQAGGAALDPATFALSYNSDTHTATVTFPGQPRASLPDGRWTLTVAGASVSDNAGRSMLSPATMSTFTFAGDANRDSAVNFADLLILAQNYESNTSPTFSTGDFDYDGTVSFGDLLILAQRYDTSLPASSLASTPARRSRAVDVVL
jgi:subtilisin-like proprotein convertase family protein